MLRGCKRGFKHDSGAGIDWQNPKKTYGNPKEALLNPTEDARKSNGRFRINISFRDPKRGDRVKEICSGGMKGLGEHLGERKGDRGVRAEGPMARGRVF